MKAVIEALWAAGAPMDLSFHALPEGDHSYRYINQYLYNVLPELW